MWNPASVWAPLSYSFYTRLQDLHVPSTRKVKDIIKILKVITHQGGCAHELYKRI